MSSQQSLSIATKLPNEIWTTILNFAFDPRQEYFYSSRKAIINVLNEVSRDFHQLTKNLCSSLPSDSSPEENDQIANYCCANDYGSLLEYVLMNGALSTHQTSIIAARFGSLDCLKILEVHGFTLSDDVLKEASLFGHIDIVKYLISKGLTPNTLTFGSAVQSGNIELVKFMQSPELAIERSQYLTNHATASGSLEMVKFIEQYFPLDSANIRNTATKGSIEILQYYLDKGVTLTEDRRICALAAEHKQWEYLKFALDHGAPMSEQLMEALAKVNAVELMRELRQKGCPWDNSAIKEAAEEGHLEALKFLVENGCPFTEVDPAGAFFAAHNDPAVLAARYNHIECLKYLIEIGAPVPHDIIDRCVDAKTSPAVVQYLRERGYQWNQVAINTAASRNNLALVKYLHENNCPWDERTLSNAARNACIECLKYALDNGCPRDDSTMDAAAHSRSIEALKICHQRGLPWTTKTCTILIQAGVVGVLKYAHENGAPWTSETINDGMHPMARVSCFDCFKYAIDHGCPWDPQSTLAIAQSRPVHKQIAQWILENCNVTKSDDASN